MVCAGSEKEAQGYLMGKQSCSCAAEISLLLIAHNTGGDLSHIRRIVEERCDALRVHCAQLKIEVITRARTGSAFRETADDVCLFGRKHHLIFVQLRDGIDAARNVVATLR